MWLRACSMTRSDNPRRFEISKALLRPGTPINNLYVGLNVFTSNSTLALITCSRLYPYAFNSG